jgi:hypothetical protein
MLGEQLNSHTESEGPLADKLAGAFVLLVLGLMTTGIVGLMIPVVVFLVGFFGVVIILGALGWALKRILS